MPIEQVCPVCGRTYRFAPSNAGKRVTCGKRCRSSPAYRFWPRVDTSGECWLWLGSLDTLGYGNYSIKGHIVRAHRMSYELTSGPIPDGLHVLHSCDNRACVRPDHLHLGTHDDNMREMVERNRVPRGERSSVARLTDDQVIEARRRYADGGISRRKLAAAYGVGSTTMQSVLERKTWRHLP